MGMAMGMGMGMGRRMGGVRGSMRGRGRGRGRGENDRVVKGLRNWDAWFETAACVERRKGYGNMRLPSWIQSILALVLFSSLRFST